MYQNTAREEKKGKGCNASWQRRRGRGSTWPSKEEILNGRKQWVVGTGGERGNVFYGGRMGKGKKRNRDRTEFWERGVSQLVRGITRRGSLFLSMEENIGISRRKGSGYENERGNLGKKREGESSV